MSGPNDTDDGWAELARELGLEHTRPTPPPMPEPVPAEELPTEDGAMAEDDFAALESDGQGESDEGSEFADEADVDGDGFDADLSEQPVEGGETGETGEPKKKRRRRRRRRKKGPGEPAAEGAEPVAVAESDTGFDDDQSEPDSPEARVEEELPSPEASRELMANWDVPSWETIITTMLYRPGGR